jgi:predicted dehydrogenase
MLLPPATLPPALTSQLRQDTQARVDAALGDASELEKRVYHGVLLDTLVHELNSVRGLLGEPDRVEHADLSERAVTVLLRFGDLPVAIHWIDLPGLARYGMEFAFYAPRRRVTLTFPSPYLRNEPSSLVTEGGDEATARSWRTEETLGYASGFRRELEEFHACAVSGTEPETSGRDGLADIMLCQAIIECHRQGRPAVPARPHPQPADTAPVTSEQE